MNELKVTEYKEQRVLTTQQLAEGYGTDGKSISYNFNSNKERYQEGKHYILLHGSELKAFREIHDLPSNINKIYLWTEKGAFLHAKSLNTDVAWEVYDRLVDTYFKKENKPLSQQDIMRIQLGMIDNHEERIGSLENTMNIDYAQQKQLKNFAKEVVVNALGGKGSSAYRHKNADGSKISSQCFSRFWRDFNDYFNINAYANLPRVRFDEALEYINRWQPPTNMQLEIGRINREN